MFRITFCVLWSEIPCLSFDVGYIDFVSNSFLLLDNILSLFFSLFIVLYLRTMDKPSTSGKVNQPKPACVIKTSQEDFSLHVNRKLHDLSDESSDEDDGVDD